MIDDSHENALRIERETHFDDGVISKVFRLVNVLEGIFSSEWKDVLALKGGTAINLFYAKLSRLSIDIDLDFIVTGKEEMLSKREQFMTFLMGWMKSKGYDYSPSSRSSYAIDSL